MADRPLVSKLGIRPGSTVAILNPPHGLALDRRDMPEGVELRHEAGPADLYLIFAARMVDAETGFDLVSPLLPPDGAIWMAWPKKSSGVETDITEDLLRRRILPRGMVDNKVIAIDGTWSGLRFVVRLENRQGQSLKR